MSRSSWFAGALALVAAPAVAQNAPSFDAERIRTHVRTLSADSFEGRAPATRGEAMTVDYLVREFKAAGLQPGGQLLNGQRQWTQDVPLLRSEIVGSPRLQITTSAGAQSLTQGEQIAVLAPLSGRNQVALTSVPMVFAGYGVTAPERQWDDFKDVDVRGKVIVVLVNDPDFEGGEGNFLGKEMTYYGRWTYKFEEAAKRGAAGVLVVHETEPASYGWATVKNSNTGPTFDIVRRDPAAAHAPVEGWLDRDTTVQLFRAAGLDFEAARQAARRRDFRPMDLKATFSADITAQTEVKTAKNVAALLPGTTRPDETVIYTAHHDHIGLGEADANGDRIFNGVVDNATGIAHLIEQARAFARAPRTQRSVVFLAVGAEEQGLLGAKYYAANPLYPLSRTAGVINTDSMGTWGPARDFSMSGNARFGLLDMLIAEGRRQGRSFTPEQNPGAGLFFRSDHFAFAQAGVPALSFKAGQDLVNGGRERGAALAKEYTANRYHQPDDEYNPQWDFSGIVKDAVLLHAVGRDLANSREWPNWSSDSEFRGTRDATAAERGTAAAANGERG
ncbi:MAG TPA: M28 family metallopeptidase [Sphingomicrobium sp.]|nr:M28 family metallopeptidase [Sphingomicrobium sp.]